MPMNPLPAADPAREQTRGMLLVLAAAVLWSCSGLFIKVLTLPVFALTGLRALLAALTLLPFMRWRAVRLNAAVGVLTFAFMATTLLFVTATRWTTAANAIALMSTSPGWVFLMSCLAARRVLVPLLWPLALVGAGIAAMLAEPAQGTSLQGNLLGVLGGVTFAAMQLSFKRIRQPAMGALVLANLGTALGCALMAPGAFQLGAITASEWVSLVFLGSMQIGLAFVLYSAGVARITVAQASVLALLEPLLSPLWVYLAIGEVPSAYGFAGFALILAGIVLDVTLRLWLPSLQPAAVRAR